MDLSNFVNENSKIQFSRDALSDLTEVNYLKDRIDDEISWKIIVFNLFADGQMEIKYCISLMGRKTHKNLNT